jgi:hypothetical protein
LAELGKSKIYRICLIVHFSCKNGLLRKSEHSNSNSLSGPDAHMYFTFLAHGGGGGGLQRNEIHIFYAWYIFCDLNAPEYAKHAILSTKAPGFKVFTRKLEQ